MTAHHEQREQDSLWWATRKLRDDIDAYISRYGRPYFERLLIEFDFGTQNIWDTRNKGAENDRP